MLGLLEFVSLLGTVFAQCVYGCVCVGGVLFMGKLHSSVMWLIYRPQLPHLTVRIEADEITGPLTHTHTSMNTHLIMLGIPLNWLLG